MLWHGEALNCSSRQAAECSANSIYKNVIKKSPKKYELHISLKFWYFILTSSIQQNVGVTNEFYYIDPAKKYVGSIKTYIDTTIIFLGG